MRRRVIQQILSSLKLLNEFLLPPGGQCLNRGVQRQGTQLEPHLVIPLAGGAVRQPLRSLFLSYLDLPLGNNGAGEGGAEEVAAFVLRVGLRKDEGVKEGGREGRRQGGGGREVGEIICYVILSEEVREGYLCSSTKQRSLAPDQVPLISSVIGSMSREIKRGNARGRKGEVDKLQRCTHLMLTLTAQKTYSFTNSSRRSSMYT